MKQDENQIRKVREENSETRRPEKHNHGKKNGWKHHLHRRLRYQVRLAITYRRLLKLSTADWKEDFLAPKCLKCRYITLQYTQAGQYFDKLWEIGGWRYAGGMFIHMEVIKSSVTTQKYPRSSNLTALSENPHTRKDASQQFISNE